ncbi:MAG: DUF3540 domain-containing protein [Desulfobacteraceae bacterium]
MITQSNSVKPAQSQWSLFHATVKGQSEETVVLETAEGVVTAATAFSCLVRPAPGDLVLASSYEQTYYVLTVLERQTTSDMQCTFPGNVSFNAPRGSIQVASADSLNLTSALKTRIVSPENALTGKHTIITGDTLETATRETKFNTGSFTVVADAVDTIAHRISQRASTVMRRVEGVETLNIGNLVQTVRKSFTSRSHHTVLTAKDEMRIDGERINMG